MEGRDNIFLRPTFIVALHVSLLFIIFCVFKNSGIPQFDVNSSGLTNFDAAWYNDLRTNGYVYKENEQSNSGFYPAFSFLWKATQFGAIGISTFNAIVFLLSFFLLNKHFNFNIKEKLLLLSIPSLIFTYVPYTESLFFLFSTILIIGLYKEKKWLIFLGIFVGSLIRPVTIIFIPAIIFIELLSERSYQTRLIRAFSVSAISISALFIVACVQYFQTGVWLAYYKAQLVHWDRAFHIPKFPLTTWGGPRNIWLDGTAFWLGLIAIVFCLVVLLKKQTRFKTDNSFLFSLAYLSGASLLVFFFDGYSDKGSTSLMGLNRYFFATPFFFIAFLYFLRLPQLTYKTYVYIILSLIFVWFLFGAYTEIDWLNRSKTIIYFSLLTISVGGCIILLNHKWFLQKKLWIFLYGGNCLLQIYLLCRFLKGDWVG